MKDVLQAPVHERDRGSSALPNLPASDPSPFPIGVESYVPTPSDPNAANEVGSIALQPEWLGARVEDAQLNAATDPDARELEDRIRELPLRHDDADAAPDRRAKHELPVRLGQNSTRYSRTRMGSATSRI